MIFKEMTDNQRRIFIDTIQLYEALLAAFKKNAVIQRRYALGKDKRSRIFISISRSFWLRQKSRTKIF